MQQNIEQNAEEFFGYSTNELPEEGTPEYKVMKQKIDEWASNLTPFFVDEKGRRINPHPRWTRFWIKLGNDIDFFFRLHFPFLFK